MDVPTKYLLHLLEEIDAKNQLNDFSIAGIDNGSWSSYQYDLMCQSAEKLADAGCLKRAFKIDQTQFYSLIKKDAEYEST